MSNTRTKTRSPTNGRNADKARPAQTRRAARMQDPASVVSGTTATATAATGTARDGATASTGVGPLTVLVNILVVLTDARVKGTRGVAARNAAEGTRRLLLGVQADYAAPDTDQLAVARRSELARAGVTPDRLAMLGKATVLMLDQDDEANQSKLDWRARVARVDGSRGAVEGEQTRLEAGVRSAFGNTSTDLTRYGVKRIGMGGGRKKGSGKATKANPASATPATPGTTPAGAPQGSTAGQ